jgi:sugar phosphate isomerase/epimerase
MVFMTISMTRRTFFKMSAAAAALTAAGERELVSAQDYGGKKVPVALQLYTIGADLRRDMAGSLASVAKLGYTGVEFAGFNNVAAQDIRKMLDDNGLKCVGCHTALNTLQGDELEKTVEFNKAIGNPRLIVPSLAGNLTATRKSIEDTADIFNGLAEKLKPLGMRTGFHCHPGEFRQVEGATVWDIFFTRANKDVIMQLDLGHAGTAGADQVAYMNKYPGRAATVHVKPANAAPLLGDAADTNKWPEIFKACESVGGTEWYIVEYDGGSMDKVVRTMDVLRRWGKV